MIAAAFVVLLASSSAFGQTFSSGSTGADGALAPSSGTSEVWIQLPESGILNYTTITIPANVTVRFKKNSQNTAVIMLAQGDVVIRGSVNLDADYLDARGNRDYTLPGPGGFAGARIFTGQPGLGPGGGVPGVSAARWVGPLSLVPPVGGSGGADNNITYVSQGGGGGGGAICIAASGSITVEGGGAISANGVVVGGGTWGSGGAIRLVASRLSMAGAIQAQSGSFGMIRLEAPLEALSYTGFSAPPPVISPINPAIAVTTQPALNIVSVGGFPVPSYAGARYDAADIVLPNSLPDPINVVVVASNIPVGSQVTATFGAGSGTVTPGVLAGTFASSTATISISGLGRSGSVTYLYVSTVFAPAPGTAAANPAGLDHVADVRVTTEMGAPSSYAFLRADGSEIPLTRLPSAFLDAYRK
jgi:hypothetical protein